MSSFKNLKMKSKMTVAAAAMMMAAIAVPTAVAPTFDAYAEEQTQDAAKQTSITVGIGADPSSVSLTWQFKSDQKPSGYAIVAKKSSLVNGNFNGKDDTSYSYEDAEVIQATNHEGYWTCKVVLSGLEAGTKYVYQLVNGDTSSPIYTFTPSKIKEDGSFSFVYAGDPQIGAYTKDIKSTKTSVNPGDKKRWEKTLNLLQYNDVFKNISFLQSAGDQINYYYGNENEYDGYLDHDFLQSIPMGVSVGNHDSNSVAYHEHFTMPNESTSYGTTTAGGDFYYTYGNVLVMNINSNDLSTAEHKAFMNKAIAATDDQDIRWRVVMFHHSIYSVANHADEQDILQRRTQWAPLFKDFDIDVVLQGHDHVYVRSYMMDGTTPMTDASVYDDKDMTSVTDPTGILYVTANSATGSKYYNIQKKNFPYAKVQSQEYTPNITKVDVTKNSFKVTTYRTEDMSKVDEFTIKKSDPQTLKKQVADLQKELTDAKKEIADANEQIKAQAEQTAKDLKEAKKDKDLDAKTIADLKKEVADIKAQLKNASSNTDKPAAVTSAVVDGVQYKVSGKTAKAVKSTKKTAAKVSIHTTVKIGDKTYKVTAISANAFKNNKKLKTVVIGKNVKTIGKNAFAGDKALKKVTVKGKLLKKVSTGAFKKAGTKKTVIKVPAAKKKAYKKLFKAAGFKGQVK